MAKTRKWYVLCLVLFVGMICSNNQSPFSSILHHHFISNNFISGSMLSSSYATTTILNTLEDEKKEEKKSKTEPSTNVAPDHRSEVPMVEELVKARRSYQESMMKLYLHYKKTNDNERMKWVEEELKQFHRIVKHAYLLELDVPIQSLQPKDNIKEANEMFRQAISYKDRGFGTDYIDNQRRAEIILQRILDQYPQSDKIGEVAYQLGDIYEHYRPTPQYKRAAAYFERSFQWNKSGSNDARLRAATLYDRRLNDKPKAKELYNSVIDNDINSARVEEAKRRLGELTGRR